MGAPFTPTGVDPSKFPGASCCQPAGVGCIPGLAEHHQAPWSALGCWAPGSRPPGRSGAPRPAAGNRPTSWATGGFSMPALGIGRPAACSWLGSHPAHKCPQPAEHTHMACLPATSDSWASDPSPWRCLLAHPAVPRGLIDGCVPMAVGQPLRLVWVRPGHGGTRGAGHAEAGCWAGPSGCP